VRFLDDFLRFFIFRKFSKNLKILKGVPLWEISKIFEILKKWKMVANGMKREDK
jgi:hypothetical protein